MDENERKPHRFESTAAACSPPMTLILLFVELLKSTYTSTASLLDHGLSMLVFVACLVEFIVYQKAATSVFFFILVSTLIDVIAGYTIGIRVARRDLSIGGNN